MTTASILSLADVVVSGQSKYEVWRWGEKSVGADSQDDRDRGA